MKLDCLEVQSNNFYITPELEEKIIEMSKSGHTQKEIMKETGKGKTAIGYILNSANYNKYFLSEEEKIKILEMRKEGITIKKIAEEFERSKSTINLILKENSLNNKEQNEFKLSNLS